MLNYKQSESKSKKLLKNISYAFFIQQNSLGNNTWSQVQPQVQVLQSQVHALTIGIGT